MAQPVIDVKLESLRHCIRRLETRCPASAEALAADVDAQDILSLNLTRAVQLCVDMAAHWLSEQPDTAAPQTMGQAFTLLAQAGLIEQELAQRMRQAVGFRNIIMHNYESIDWDIVHLICSQRLDDFRQFATTVFNH